MSAPNPFGDEDEAEEVSVLRDVGGESDEDLDVDGMVADLTKDNRANTLGASTIGASTTDYEERPAEEFDLDNIGIGDSDDDDDGDDGEEGDKVATNEDEPPDDEPPDDEPPKEQLEGDSLPIDQTEPPRESEETSDSSKKPLAKTSSKMGGFFVPPMMKVWKAGPSGRAVSPPQERRTPDSSAGNSAPLSPERSSNEASNPFGDDGDSPPAAVADRKAQPSPDKFMKPKFNVGKPQGKTVPRQESREASPASTSPRKLGGEGPVVVAKPMGEIRVGKQPTGEKTSGKSGINLAAVPIVAPTSAAGRSAKSTTTATSRRLTDNLRTLCRMGFVYEVAKYALANSKADKGKKGLFGKVVREAGANGEDGDNVTDALRQLNEQLRGCIDSIAEAAIWKSPMRAKVASWLPNIPDPDTGDVCTGYVMDVHLVRTGINFRVIKRYNQFFDLKKDLKAHGIRDRMKAMTNKLPDDRFGTAVKGTGDKTRNDRMAVINHWMAELLDAPDIVPASLPVWESILEFFDAREPFEGATDNQLAEGALSPSPSPSRHASPNRYAKR